MTKEHTPTPWKATKYHEAWSVRAERSEIEYPIAEMWETIFSSEANAAHIVKCVNMHDELVEIAKTALKMLDDPVHWSISNPFAGGFDDKKLEALLKKAGAI